MYSLERTLLLVSLVSGCAVDGNGRAMPQEAATKVSANLGSEPLKDFWLPLEVAPKEGSDPKLQIRSGDKDLFTCRPELNADKMKWHCT